MLLSSVLVAVMMAAAAIVISVVSSGTRASEIARQVTPEVVRQVIADSRAQRIGNARGVLAAANQVLADRGLPMVADPGPAANAEQILAAASSAQVLSVLPEQIVQQLRDQLDGRPIVLPSTAVAEPGGAPAQGTAQPGTGAPGTGSGPGAAPGAGGGDRGGGAPGAAPAPAQPGAPPAAAPPQNNAPAPAPIPTRRRLIPPLVPIPGLPLIGT